MPFTLAAQVNLRESGRLPIPGINMTALFWLKDSGMSIRCVCWW